MTISTVLNVAGEFLKTTQAEVLVIKGAWGAGKTFAWNQLVRKTSADLARSQYAYVSLFGLRSLSELRLAILANTREREELSEKAETSQNAWSWWGWNRRWAKRAHQLSKLAQHAWQPIKGLTIALEEAAPFLINDMVVCIDDLERLSGALPLEEVLGFVSGLKETKNCKIALIFNADAMEKMAVYQSYREKVVDIELEFSPTADEAADLAFQSKDAWGALVRARALKLDITNIRLLRKIERLGALIHTKLQDCHEAVLRQAASTLVLATWCYYEPKQDKPTLDALRAFDVNVLSVRRSAAKHQGGLPAPLPGPEVWERLLDDYGYHSADELDLAIMTVVAHGYVESSGLELRARELDQQARADDLENSYKSAWRMFHESFADNADEFVRTLRSSFEAAAMRIAPGNLDGAVRMLRRIGKDAVADQLIDYYVERRGSELRLFDLDENPFGSDIGDQRLRERFATKWAEAVVAHPVTLREVVYRLVDSPARQKADLNRLKEATEDDYFELFKEEHGPKLHAVIDVCLVSGGIEGFAIVRDRANAALDRIALESPLNAARVDRHRGGRGRS